MFCVVGIERVRLGAQEEWSRDLGEGKAGFVEVLVRKKGALPDAPPVLHTVMPKLLAR